MSGRKLAAGAITGASQVCISRELESGERVSAEPRFSALGLMPDACV